MSFMKIGTVEVLACVGATNELFVRHFHIYYPICLKINVINPQVILLRICDFSENRLSGDGNLLMTVCDITFKRAS